MSSALSSPPATTAVPVRANAVVERAARLRDLQAEVSRRMEEHRAVVATNLEVVNETISVLVEELGGVLGELGWLREETSTGLGAKFDLRGVERQVVRLKGRVKGVKGGDRALGGVLRCLRVVAGEMKGMERYLKGVEGRVAELMSGVDVNVGETKVKIKTGLGKVVPDIGEGWKLVDKRADGIIAHETEVDVAEPMPTPAAPYRGFVGHELPRKLEKRERKEKRGGSEYTDHAAKLASVS